MILTLLFLFLVLAGIACILIYLKTDGEGWQATGVILVAFIGVALLISIIQLSTREMRASSEIVKIEAVRETFGRARADKSIYPIENAAIQLKIAETNEWIAHAKFWADHPLTNWFWSRRILEIEPIR